MSVAGLVIWNLTVFQKKLYQDMPHYGYTSFAFIPKSTSRKPSSVYRTTITILWSSYPLIRVRDWDKMSLEGSDTGVCCLFFSSSLYSFHWAVLWLILFCVNRYCAHIRPGPVVSSRMLDQGPSTVVLQRLRHADINASSKLPEERNPS